MSYVYFRGEYFLADYLEKIGNFNANYIESIFAIEGYHDLYNVGKVSLSKPIFASTITKRKGDSHVKDGKRTFEFVFIPNAGFLNSNLPLLNNCELKLSFDRINASVAMLEGGSPIKESCVGKPLQIKDCVAITEYVKSDSLEKHFAKIDYNPIPYYYQDCEVTLKSLPSDETDIRLDNIRGGRIPLCMFAGIIPSKSLNGDILMPSTGFMVNNVKEVNITLNGNSVNGYPIENKSQTETFPFYKFLDVTSRYMNPICGEGLRVGQFKYNFLYAHRFEAETSSQGWLGMNFKLSAPYSEPHTLVIWTINDCGLTIDKFHQIEKIEL